MTIARVNGAGWGTDDELTSAQINQLDINITTAVDGAGGGTYAPSAVLEIAGKGLQIDLALLQTRAISGTAYTLDASGDDVILSCDASNPVGLTVNLPAAVPNRVVFVKVRTGTNGVYITPNGTDTIDGTNIVLSMLSVGRAVMLVGVSGGWEILASAGKEYIEFLATALSGWTAPSGVYSVEIEACGGGGGGGGGTSGTTATSSGAGGGSGGGGAPLVRQRVPVTPGTVYDIVVGTGGAGGAAASDGSDGTVSKFSVHSSTTLFSALGGGKGFAGVPIAGSTSVLFIPGGTIQAAAYTGVESSQLATLGIGQSSQGGFGGTHITGGGSTAGSYSANGNASGSLAGNGTNSTTSFGGAAGGSGGGGGFGAGGPSGAGGNGNNAGAGSVGTAGTAASANTGGGGGGGGGGGCGSSSGGTGGAGNSGGTGRLRLYY